MSRKACRNPYRVHIIWSAITLIALGVVLYLKNGPYNPSEPGFRLLDLLVILCLYSLYATLFWACKAWKREKRRRKESAWN